MRKLANSRHAPADWIMRARMIVRSWDGLRTKAIAEELGCHPQTVRERFHRFNAQGIDGLGDLPGAGRKRRITEAERSRIIALVATDPPGRLVARCWRRVGGRKRRAGSSLDTGCPYRCRSGKRHHRRTQPGKAFILKAEGVRWRNPHPWGESDHLRSLPQKDEGPHALHQPAFENSTTICLDELGPVSPRTYPPAPGWSPDGHRISRRPWNTDGDPKRSGSTVLCACATARRSRSPLPRAIPKATCGYSKPSSGGIRAAICTS